MKSQTVETEKMNRQQHSLDTIKIQIIKSILLYLKDYYNYCLAYY